MARLPRLSIVSKLYAIFALLATVAVILTAVAVASARRHVELTAEFEAALQGAQTVERMNSLIHAVVMESRGVYMSRDPATAADYAGRLMRPADDLMRLLSGWEQALQPEQADAFRPLGERLRQFYEFRKELARLGREAGPEAARALGDNDANRSGRIALNRDLTALGADYAQQAREAYEQASYSSDTTAACMIALSVLAVLLAVAGGLILWRGLARPLAAFTRLAGDIAEGRDVAIPYAQRHDEAGALARAIGHFQQAMTHNRELHNTVTENAEARERRQQALAAEVAGFTASIEISIANLNVIADQVLESAALLADAADRAARRTEAANGASGEASSNVRDIAAAADELAASVMEIDRQVAQSTAIAEKAANEAERTNAAVQELNEAGRRIGDIISLITDIAEQTNLLALNATIEAARAGEAGRGFAVVAGEVKALAGQTAQATEDIARQISDMQHATARSIEAIGAIERIIGDIGAISSAISAAVTQQGAATQEIARSVDVAGRRTSDAAEEVSRVADVAENTRANVAAVRHVAEELGEVAHRIRDQVEEFSKKLRAA